MHSADASTSAMSSCMAAVERACAAIDADEGQHIEQKLLQRLRSPPTALLSSVLGSPNFCEDEARQLLFTPSAAHMQLYAEKLLTGSTADPANLDIAANRVQLLALTHMYLMHGKCWQLVKPFIAAGGLSTLVALLGHPNAVMAAQALHLLILATHPDMYDWMRSNAAPGASNSSSSSSCTSNGSPNRCEARDSTAAQVGAAADAVQEAVPAPDSNSSHPATGPDGVLWQELAQLQSGPLFSLLLQLSPDVWPGSGYQALQLMAFYLSWLSKWWSKDGVIQLSAALLSGLKAWSARTTADRQERELAAQLVQDFARFGQAPALLKDTGGIHNSSPCDGDSGDVAGVKDDGAVLDTRVTADRTQVNSKPGSKAEKLKAAGNDAFHARDWSTAVQLYSAALDVAVPADALVNEAPRRAAYHANRAAAYLERFKEVSAAAAKASSNDGSTVHSTGGSSSSSSSSLCWREVGGLLDGLLLDGSQREAQLQLLDAVIMDCRSALSLVPHHAKAHFRLAAALKAKGGNNLSSALAATKAAQEHATCTADRAAAVRLQEVITKQLAAQQAAAGQRGQVLQAPAQQQQQHMQPQRRAANADSSKAQAYGVSSSAAASVSIKCDVDGIGAGSACRPHVDGKPSSTSNSTSGSSWDCIRSDAVHKQQHQHELLSRDDDKPTISTGIRSDTSGCAAVPAGLGCGTSSSKSSRSSSTDAVEQLLQQFVSALQQPGGSSTPRSSEDVQRPSRSSTHTSTRGAAGVTMPVAGNHKRDCAGDIEVHLKPLLPNGPGGSCASKPPQMYPASKPLIEVLTSSDTSLDDDHLVTD